MEVWFEAGFDPFPFKVGAKLTFFEEQIFKCKDCYE